MYYTLFIAILLISTLGYSQESPSDDAFAKVYQGYLRDSQDIWEQGLKDLDNIYTNSGEKDLKVLYKRAIARYGLIGFYLSDEKNKEAKELIELTEEDAEKLAETDIYASEGNALLGSLVAMRLGMAPYKAMFLGPKSDKLISRSLELGPNVPNAWIEKGNMRYHAPSLFGGDKEQAVICFQKAIELFDSQPANRKNNWLYLHAYAWQGQAYMELEKPAKAIEVYKKALAYEPNFGWIKNDLLPAAEAKK